MLRKLTIGVMLLALLLMGAFTVLAQDENILLYPITTDPSHLNMFTNDEIANSTVLNQIYEGLLDLDPGTGELVPQLAESYDVAINDEGQQVFTFHLRQGVLFHNIAGVELEDRELTADDVLWNFMVALNADPDISEPTLASNMRFVVGAEEYTTAMQEMLDAGDEVPLIMDDMDVPGLQVIDDYTFEITLRTPDRLFLVNGMPNITSPEAYEKLGEDFNNTPVGTGPFQFVEWLRQDRVVLEANPDYYIEGLPMVDGIRFINYGDENTALLDYREGNLDFLFSFPSGQRTAIMNEFPDDFHENAGTHIRYWGFNMVDGQLAEEPLVRQAFAYALDRETAWNVFSEGSRFPATLGFLPPSAPASTPSMTYQYDLDKAAELLTEAGYPNGEGLPTINIYLLESISDEAQVVVWQEALESLGISINFVIEDGSTYWDNIRTEKADIFQNGWNAGIPEPAEVFDYLILNGEGSMRWDDPDVDALLTQARLEIDPVAREALYQQVHDIVMEEMIVIPSAYSKIAWLQKSYIEGFEPGGMGIHHANLAIVTKSQ
ncbi:MAG: ABC transporter substrate-binding protein [Anaerolineae bacterium]|nr:ABC transporter substrate-binding protein [Anaerolineae bacterium]